MALYANGSRVIYFDRIRVKFISKEIYWNKNIYKNNEYL